MSKKKTTRRRARPAPPPADRCPNSIGIIADLHCGSKWGLFPPEWIATKSPSNIIQANIAQKYLWEWWLWTAHAWREKLGGDLDLLIVNGDVMEGKQPKDKSTGLVTADLNEQADIAAQCLDAFCSILHPRVKLRTAGSKYHEAPDNPIPALDEKLGFKCDVEFKIELPDGRCMQVQHDPGSTGAIYKGTIVDRTILWSNIAENLNKVPSIGIIVRSHLHYYHMMQTHGKTYVMVPCWKLQDCYAKKNRFRWTPDLGGVLLTRDDDAYCGYQIHRKDIMLPAYEREAVGYEDI